MNHERRRVRETPRRLDKAPVLEALSGGIVLLHHRVTVDWKDGWARTLAWLCER